MEIQESNYRFSALPVNSKSEALLCSLFILFLFPSGTVQLNCCLFWYDSCMTSSQFISGVVCETKSKMYSLSVLHQWQFYSNVDQHHAPLNNELIALRYWNDSLFWTDLLNDSFESHCVRSQWLWTGSIKWIESSEQTNSLRINRTHAQFYTG